MFLTLDAKSRITSMYAPWAYGLPYVYADGEVKENYEGGFTWNSKRKSNGIGIKGNQSLMEILEKLRKAVLKNFCLKDIVFTLHIKIKHI